MADTYRKKSGIDSYDTINPSTGLCQGLNFASFGCLSSRSRIPPFGEDVEIVNVQNFCAAGPYADPGPRPDIAGADGLASPSYFGELSAWGKQHARRIKFSEWCECVPSTGPECQNNANAQTQQFAADNPTYTGWLSITKFEIRDDSVGMRPGDINTVYSTGDRCPSSAGPDGGLTRLRDGEDDGCMSGGRGGGRTLSSTVYWICGSDPEPIPEPDEPEEEGPDTPPPTSIDNPTVPGPPGEAGPAGPQGPQGEAGPCPTLIPGDLIISSAEEDALEITNSGDCTYTVTIRIKDLEKEQRTVLKGVRYVVLSYPPSASFQFVEDNLYFIPRVGALQFRSSLTGEFSESIELHMNSGYVRNPNRLLFDTFTVTPYLPSYQIKADRDELLVNVVIDTIIPSD